MHRPYQPLVATSRNWSQLAVCLRTTPFAPFCLHTPPRAPLSLRLRLLFLRSIPSVFRFNSLLLSSSPALSLSIAYAFYTRCQHSQRNLLLRPCIPASSVLVLLPPRSNRLDLLCIVHGKVSSVDPRLFILRWPFQGCDHVSNSHGGFIVYPIFTILSSSGGFLAASPVPFAASSSSFFSFSASI